MRRNPNILSRTDPATIPDSRVPIRTLVWEGSPVRIVPWAGGGGGALADPHHKTETCILRHGTWLPRLREAEAVNPQFRWWQESQQRQDDVISSFAQESPRSSCRSRRPQRVNKLPLVGWLKFLNWNKTHRLRGLMGFNPPRNDPDTECLLTPVSAIGILLSFLAPTSVPAEDVWMTSCLKPPSSDLTAFSLGALSPKPPLRCICKLPR